MLLAVAFSLAACGSDREEIRPTPPDAKIVADVTQADGTDAGDASDSIADTNDTALPTEGCPVLPGPPMQRIQGTSPFCIDVHEVSNEDYAAFLADAKKPTLESFCDHDGDRGTAVADPTLAQRPATSLGWCDAYAYCKWAGKRLCGRMGGGHGDPSTFASPTTHQWSLVCRNGDPGQPYPWGPAYVEGMCTTTGPIVDVNTSWACHGTRDDTANVYDLVGNAAEWEDACDDYGSKPASDRRCRARGGSVSASAGCDFDQTLSMTETSEFVGFRCCIDR